MIERRRNRTTGTIVELYDSRHPDNVFDPDGGRWITVCVDHSRLVNHKTLALARYHLADPSGYCGGCNGEDDE